MPDAESGIFFEIVMNKNKIIVLLIALVAVFAYNKMQNKQPETFAKKSFPQQPKPKQRFSAAFVSNIH